MGPRVCRPHRTALVALAATLTVLAAGCWSPSFTAGAYDVVVTSNVVYGRGEIGRSSGGGTYVDLKLDLYQPQATGQAELPLVVIVHGGGNVSGSKTSASAVIWANAFAERGYMVASIDYRLTGVEPVPSARVQALYDAVVAIDDDPRRITTVTAIDDTLTALDFLIARPDVNDVQTTLIGESAGAITVDHVAYALDDFGITRPPVAAVISNWGGLPIGEGAGFIENPPVQTDPLFYEPPIFLAHATGDTTVPYQRSVEIAERAEEVGLDYRFFTKVGVAHNFGLRQETWAPGVTVLDAQINFVTCTIYPHVAGSPECP